MNRVKTHRFVNVEAGRRLDHFLVQQFPDASRRFLKRQCEEGRVQVNGSVRRGGYLLKCGEIVELIFDHPPEARPEIARAEGGLEKLLPILFEDEHLIAVSKRRAMHSVTLRDDDPVTVSDCLAAYSESCFLASQDRREAGLVQRLDYFTSGVLVAAKSEKVWYSLREQLFRGGFRKTYLALVEGTLTEERIRVSLALRQRNDGSGMEVVSDHRNGQNFKQPREGSEFSAETNVELVETITLGDEFRRSGEGRALSIIRATATRVRRHQIRVHLAALGHPLVGDELYGSRLGLTDCGLFTDATPSGRFGFLLHAESVELEHPVTARPIRIIAASELFEQLVQRSRQHDAVCRTGADRWTSNGK